MSLPDLLAIARAEVAAGRDLTPLSQMACCLNSGTGGAPRDPALACAIWGVLVAATPPHPDAAFNLGVALDTGGLGGVALDAPRAARLYAVAAAAGDARAQINLARLFRLGRGVAQDFKRSTALLEDACRQGSAMAQMHLGAYLKGGVFAPSDAERALGLFRAAAAQGDAAATAIVARWPADDVAIVLLDLL